MIPSRRAVPGRVFISYRREEAAYPAGWLFDRVADRFGGDQIFKDVDSIDLGDDFMDVITAAISSCQVLLAVIGQRWLTVTDDKGHRRLDDPDDFVRLEIEAALNRNILVIPILVDGARMPRRDELPASMVKLAHRNALQLSPDRFSADTGRLLTILEGALAESRTDGEEIQKANQEHDPRRVAARPNPAEGAQALVNLANILVDSGRPEEAIDLYQKALQLFRERGDRKEQGQTLNNLRVALQRTGRLEEAAAAQRQTIMLFRET
jgi:hypothetical protein